MKSLKSKNLSFIAFYTVIFAAVSMACFSFYFILGKTFFTTGDGRSQHIAAHIYYGKYLRSIFYNLFAQGKLVIPQWDFNLGFGADIIQTFHYYVIGDPFSFLSVFFSPEKTPVLYTINIFLRLYCIGLAFFAYCKYHNFDRYASLCGAFVYIFCGFSFYCAVRHPYFVNPMIWLPLLLIGIDKIFDNKNFLPFAFFVFIACASNFYFFYMLSIIVFIYAIVRFFFKFPKQEYKDIWKYILLALAGYFLGICMAAFIFFPNVSGFLSCGRSEENNPLTLIYRTNYYIKMILGFIAPSTFGSYSTFGYAAPALPLIIILFTMKDKIAKQIKIFLSIGIIFFLFPVFGCIFNGFSYVSNRWGFAFSFVIAIGIVYAIPIATNSNFKEIKNILITCFAISFFVFALSLVSKDVREQFFLAYIVLFLCTLLLFIFYYFKKSTKVLYFVMIIFSAIFQGNFRYAPKGLDYLHNTPTQKQFSLLLQEYTTPIKTNDNDFYRIETSNLQSPNVPAVIGIKGTTYYWSINNGLLYDFYKEKNLTGNALSSHGLELHSELFKLFNVKYYLVPENKENEIPQFFKDTGEKYLEYKIFRNTEFSPFGLALSGEHIENVKIGCNTLAAEANFSNDSSVFLSIPYSKFWKAKIDGNKVEIKLAKTAFMELAIPKGNHNIELTYTNNYSILGAIVTAIAFFVFLILNIKRKIKVNKNYENHSTNFKKETLQQTF